jgi:hypothetical protein
MTAHWSALVVATIGSLPAAQLTAVGAASEPFIVRHWPELLFTVIGVLLPVVWSVASSLIRFANVYVNPTRHPERALVGIWFVYHFSRHESKELMRSERWEMKFTWRGQIAVRTSDEQMADLIYKGWLEEVDAAQMTCRMRGVLHHEEFFIRIIYPIPARGETTFGLHVGENFDHDLFSTLYLFTRERLSGGTAARRLRRKLAESARLGLNGIVLHSGGTVAENTGHGRVDADD